jgi:hypothetical protein
MPCVGFEPTIQASERAKTVHALERSATVTGADMLCDILSFKLCFSHTRNVISASKYVQLNNTFISHPCLNLFIITRTYLWSNRLA